MRAVFVTAFVAGVVASAACSSPTRNGSVCTNCGAAGYLDAQRPTSTGCDAHTETTLDARGLDSGVPGTDTDGGDRGGGGTTSGVGGGAARGTTPDDGGADWDGDASSQDAGDAPIDPGGGNGNGSGTGGGNGGTTSGTGGSGGTTAGTSGSGGTTAGTGSGGTTPGTGGSGGTTPGTGSGGTTSGTGGSGGTTPGTGSGGTTPGTGSGGTTPGTGGSGGTTPGTGGPASLWASAALPALNSATVAHIDAVRAVGAQNGNRAAVFARCGDSITASTSFLTQIGTGDYQLGSYTPLESTISAYRALTLSDGTNSFTHSSLCAVPGWTTADALAPPSAIAAELDAIKPGTVIIMFGTNDSQQLSIAAFTANMNSIVDIVEARGTVLVLSTAPPRTDYAGADDVIVSFNTAIAEVASSRNLPLIDLHAALDPLPSRGIGSDGVHPTVETVNAAPVSADFTSTGLEYGYDIRNLTALQMLDRLRAIP